MPRQVVKPRGSFGGDCAWVCPQGAVTAADAQHPFDLSATESAEYVWACHRVTGGGREPDMQFTGKALTAAWLARHHGFTDADGRQRDEVAIPSALALD